MATSSQKKIDRILTDYNSSKKSSGTEKAPAAKAKTQYQSSQDKISGYLKEHEAAVKNSPSRQQMIAMEREAAEKEAAKKAQQQANVNELMRERAIDSIESQAMAAIQQRLQQGKGAFEQTDREQGPFSGYEDPVQLALNVQELRGVGPQKTWVEDALKLGQQAIDKKRQEYAQQGSVDEYAQKNREIQPAFEDPKEHQNRYDRYIKDVPYLSDFEEVSQQESEGTKRKRTEEEAKKYEEEKFWAEVNGSAAPLGLRNQEQDLIDKYVSDEQLKVYNYLVNSGQKGYADEYWQGVKNRAQAARNAADIKFTRDALAKLPEGLARDAVGSVLSVGANMANAAAGQYYIADHVIREALTGKQQELDPQDMAFHAGRARDALRQDVSEKLPGWGKFLYDTGMSMADTAAMGLALGPTGGALLMGSGAAVDTVRDVKERGGSDQQALAMGVIAGGAELLTEKIQFDRLADLVGGSKTSVLREIVAEVFSEGMEEGTTEIANILADTLVMGDKNEYNAMVSQYVAQGMSEEAAHKQALVDLAKQVGLAALGGAISGGVMGGGSAAIGTAVQTAERNAWREAVNYDAATNIFTEGARGGSTYEYTRKLAQQAYENQQAQEAPARATEALEAAAEANAEAAAQAPRQRAVNPAIEQMAQEYGEDAGLFMAHYEGGDETAYKRGFDAMFRAGQSGLPLNMLGGVSDQLTAGMSEATKQAIYTAGRNKAAQTITPGAKNLTTRKLTSEQRTFLRVWDAIGKEYGFEVDLVDDVTGANGAYRSGGRRIVVSAKAAEGAYIQAAGHETVHYLKSVNPEGYNVLEDVVLGYLKDSGFDVENAVSARMKQYAKQNLTREQALEEIVAETVPTFFGDKEAVRAFAAENRTLAEKIRDFFYKFVEKVREIAERYATSQNRDEIRAIIGNTEALTEIAKTLDTALRGAQGMEGKDTGEIMTARRRSNDADDLSKWTPDARFMEEIMTTAERGIFRTIMNDRKNLPAHKMPNGEYVIEAGRALVYTDGKMTNPRIRQIVYFYTNDGTDLDGAMDLWRRGEREGIEYERTRTIIESILGEEGVVVYHNDDFREIQGKDNRRTGTNGRRIGEGNRGEVSAEEERLTEVGLAVSEDGEAAYPESQDVLYSLKTLPETDYIKERDKAAAALSKRLGVTAEEAQRYIDNLTSISAIVAADQMRLDFEAEEAYGAVKPNSDYKWTVDFSTLCKKRLLYTGTFDAIQKQLADVILTENDYIRLREMMAEKEYEVACAFCYVESRRKDNGRIIAEFLKVYREAQQGDGIMELGPKNRRKKFRTERGFDPEIASFNTSDGFTDILHNHRGVYDAYMYFMNARGVSKPKLIESRTAYTQEILAKFKSASTVKAMNRRGGLRLQSFSDFEVVNLLDMMQVVTDMSRVGLMSQAYTKVPEFARVFGGTGIKINLSLVTKGVDENNNLIFDDVEGMPHKEAFRIREMYGDNVGTILVGKDDATIRAAMKDPRIDYIIPFHASGWSLANQAALGIAGYENYTKGQLETDAKTGKTVGKQYYPADYWDDSKTGDENAQIYLDMCKKSGRNPKFPKFAGESGYWKMLIDFRMYDNDGNYAPQRPVRPDINMDEARRVLDEYRGGHNKLPVARDVVEQFMQEYREEHAEDGEIRYSMKEDGPVETALEEDQNMRLPADVQVDSETIRRQAATAIQVGLRAKLNQQIKGVTARILKETGSKYKRADLEESIREIVSDYARHGFNDGSMRRVSEIAKAIIGAGAEAGADIMAQDADLAAANLALRIQGDVMGMIGAKNAAQQLYGSAQRMREQFRKEYEAELRERQRARVAEFQRIAGELKAAKEKGDSAEQKRIMGQYRTALKNVDAETAISVVNAANKVRTEQREEIRERAQLREKVTKRANELMDMLAGRKKGKRVPTMLQGLVMDVLGALDINGERAAEAFTESKKAAQFREKLTGIKNFYTQVWDSQSKGESPEGLDGLMMTISERNMADIAKDIEALGNGGAVMLREMNSEQLRSLNSLLKEVTHTVNSIGKLWKMKRYESIIELGDQSIAEMDSRGKQKINEATAAGKTRDFFALDMMEPVSYGERLGEAGQEIIQGLLDGEKEKFGKIREASEATKRMLKEVGVTSRDIGKWKKHVQTVELGGKKVKMTDAMLMSLYLTAKRPQGRQHLLANGMRLPTTKETGAQVTTLPLTDADLSYAAGLLTDKQRALADRMGNFLSTAVAKWGNDVTQRMYLYDAFTEKNYWPITSDPNVLKTQEPEGERAFNAIINAGFTKPVNQKATNAVIVQDAFDVFGGHIGEMASYAGYAEVMTDTLAWLNYKKRNSESGLIEGSVKESVEKLLGKGGIRYLTKLVQDINGARRGGDNVQLNKLLGNYKKAAVMGKIRVAIQQPTSIVRAAAEINPVYLLKAMRFTKGLDMSGGFVNWLKSNKTIEEMQKWSNLAWWKANGNYEIGVGKGTDEILWGKTSMGDVVMDKIATQGGLVDPGKMDDLTWAHMWLAVKDEISRKRKDLKVGSDEYFRAVAERFEYIMDRTQVVDTVMHRSDLMRSKDGMNKMLTSFMGEPTKSNNMLMRAVMEAGRNPKSAGSYKKLGRSMLTFAASAAATAAMTALYDAFRYRDDEDEIWTYLESRYWGDVWEQFLKAFVSNVNPIETVAGVKDVYDMVVNDGDVPTIMAFEGISDAVYAVQTVMNYFNGNNSRKSTVYGAIKPVLTAASTMLGLPVSGILTNVETVGRVFDPKWMQTKSEYATQGKAYEKLYKAIVEGQTNKAKEIRTQLSKGLYGANPKTPKEIDSGIARNLALDDERILRYWQMREKGNQYKEMVALRKEIQKDGFTEEHVVYAGNIVESQLTNQYRQLMEDGKNAEAKELKEYAAKYGMTLEEAVAKDMTEELDPKTFQYDHLFAAIRNGDMDDVEGVAGVMELESDAEDPEKAIRNQVSSEFREEYIEAVRGGDARKVNDLDKKLDYFGIDEEDRVQWAKDDRYDDLGEALNAGNTTKADKYVAELRESGVSDEGIASSVRSRFKQTYIDLVVNGDDDEAEELYEMLNGLGLVTDKKKENYFTRKKMDKWVEDWEKAQKD